MALDVHALAEVHPEEQPAFEVEHHAPSALGRLRDELLDIGRLVPTSLDLASMAARQTSALDVAAVLRFVPPLPTVLPHVSAWMRETAENTAFAGALDEFAAYFRRVRATTIGLASRTSADESAAKAWADLAGEWRAVAKLLLRTLGECRAREAQALSQGERSRLDWVTAGLDAACRAREGSAADGSSKPPAVWAERRERNRSRVSTHILLQVRDGIQRALIIDASSDGLGLWGVRDGNVGDPVRLMVSPGWSIEGVIVWREALRAGVYLVPGDARDAELIGRLVFSRQGTES